MATLDGQPPSLFPPYKSTVARAPQQAPIRLAHTATEYGSAGVPWERLVGPAMPDLTAHGPGRPQGQRINVGGRVLDEQGRPVAGAMIEIWQANAAGRYIHSHDTWDAPIDPNFTGTGRVVTGRDGDYGFATVRPGAYPWGNHHNAWRPAHIHLSILGPTFASRLVTQMYFPDDPLIGLDPIACAVPPEARSRLVSRLDLALTEPNRALGYRFDIVLRGMRATPFETAHAD